ncbi:HD-GYP domain-containing protein [Janthinobacterium sp. HLS12-2]|uniref:HD-GYP domain-containing protein n=1 Tax=Janthinobacterium sp. HLS12-2 TaxID=1259324 RepID=UPI003F28D97C
MLKKITSSELVLGLYVERLARSWLATPFWTRSFLLESPADLERIRTARHCEVYDAITSNRPYKKGWCPAESLRRMAAWRGGHLDARLFAAFVKCLGIYPLGTLVRLQSERLAVVVGQAAGKTLTSPTVRVFFSIRAGTCIAPCVIDLAAPGCQERVVSTESAERWGLLDVDRYWAGEPAVA